MTDKSAILGIFRQYLTGIILGVCQNGIYFLKRNYNLLNNRSGLVNARNTHVHVHVGYIYFRWTSVFQQYNPVQPDQTDHSLQG